MNAIETTLTLRLLSEYEGVPVSVIKMLVSFIADGDTTYLRNGETYGDMRPPVAGMPHLYEDESYKVDLCSGYDGQVWVTPHLREVMLYWFQHKNGYAGRDSYNHRGVMRPMLGDEAVHAWLGVVP